MFFNKYYKSVCLLNLTAFSASIFAGPSQLSWTKTAHAGIISDRPSQPYLHHYNKREHLRPLAIIDDECHWLQNAKIRVLFLDGDADLRETVRKISQKWMSHTGLTFNFVDQGPADIRISFNDSLGAWSNVGNCSSPDQTVTTMSLGAVEDTNVQTQQRIILHEFGHALGFFHEHQHPDADIQWNLQGIEANKPTWSLKEIEANYITVMPRTSWMTPYDPTSIMHYVVTEDMTTNGYSVGYNCRLSDQDKQLIGLVYPGGSGIDTSLEPLCCDPSAPFQDNSALWAKLGCSAGLWGSAAVISGGTFIIGCASIYLIKKIVRCISRARAIPHIEEVEDVEEVVAHPELDSAA